MPWRETDPMDQKLLFIADYVRGGRQSFVELCHAYGISRKTGYKWIHRYELNGVDGLGDCSRRPKSHPNEIPFAMRQAIIDLRKNSRVKLGAKKISRKLKELFPGSVPPSLTCIHNILTAENLVDPIRKVRRVARFPSPLRSADGVNDLWSVDFKGQFKLQNGQWCYPLTIMDHASRYLLVCKGLSGTGCIATRKAFERLFLDCGLPLRIRSDNGVPFASKAAGGLSQLSIWWIRLGITPERIQPGKPQQNGIHERMHRTLKQAATKPAGKTFKSQQEQFDQFRKEYNEQRPHEALQQDVPSQHYRPSPRAYPKKLPSLEYPEYFDVLKVRPSGIIYWGGGQVYISHLLTGEKVGLTTTDGRIWDAYFGHVRLGSFDRSDFKKGKTTYWSIKV